MRISNKTQLGLRFDNELKDNIFYNIQNSLPTRSDTGYIYTGNKIEFSNRMSKLLDETNDHYYLIANTVLEMCDKLRLPDNFDPCIFKTIPREKRTLLLGNNKCIKYYFENENTIVVGIFKYTDETEFFNYDTFSINLITGAFGIYKDKEGLFSEIYNFCKIITFIDLAKIDILILNANQSAGTKKSGKTKNDSKFNITIINSDWNKYVIRTEGFSVQGHFRFQPYGEKLLLRKIIWINSYEKHGYTKHPKT